MVAMVDDSSKRDESENGAPRTDYSEHEATYGAFLTLMKRAMIVIALVLVGMAIFLT